MSVPAEMPVDALQARRDEVAAYDQTIAVYQFMVDTMPSEWPSHLAQFKGRTDPHQAIAEIDDLDDVQTVCDLWAVDNARAAIRANMVERAKALSILTALEAQQA